MGGPHAGRADRLGGRGRGLEPMTPDGPPVSSVTAYHEALLAAAPAHARLVVVEAELSPTEAFSSWASRFPSRYVSLQPPELAGVAAEQGRAGGPAFVGAPVAALLGGAFPDLVRSVVVPRLNVKLVGFPPTLDHAPREALLPVRDDLGTWRSLPGMTVIAPADGPTVPTAVAALVDRDGPAYVRLPPHGAPTVTDGTFSIGRAHELRAGSDLAILALGPMLGPAVEAADELAGVGVSVRVLDLASVKPLDEPAVLRAARDTGALLVLEGAPLATGLGTFVAALTAENVPVPVRRLGFPDLWPPGNGIPAWEEQGLSLERVRDEAWELLRLRGRIA